MPRHDRRQRMPRGPRGGLDLRPVRTRRANACSRVPAAHVAYTVRYRRFRNGARSGRIARGDPHSEVFGGRALWLPQALPEGWRIRDGDRRYRAIPGAGTFAPSSVPRAESRSWSMMHACCANMRWHRLTASQSTKRQSVDCSTSMVSWMGSLAVTSRWSCGGRSPR